MRFDINKTQGILTEAAKTERRYKCPFCEKRDIKTKLVNHVEKEHQLLIPEGYTAARVVFNNINKKDHGTCVCGCGKETAWREDLWRYDRYATLQCKEKYSKEMKQRMMRVYGKEHLLNDPETQEKMLNGRSISGTYKFSKGGEASYVGTYERKLLEFLDKVMGYKAIDIQSPGPVIEYEYNGEKHFWITDQYLVPYNLVFDVKDGGDNPNTRDMEDYRAKQLAKEKAIIEQGKYNYIRLTNNNFAQLLYILAEIKESMMDENKKEFTPIVKINEAKEEKKDDKKKKEDYSTWTLAALEAERKVIKRKVDNERINGYSMNAMDRAEYLEKMENKIKKLDKYIKEKKEAEKKDDDNEDDEYLDEYCSPAAGAMVGITNNPNAYIVNYLKKGSFIPDYGIAADENLSSVLISDDMGKLFLKSKKYFQNECETYAVFKYSKSTFANEITWETTNLFEIATGKRLLHPEQLFYDSDFTRIMTESEKNEIIQESFEATLRGSDIKIPVINREYMSDPFIMFYEDNNGYFVENRMNGMRSKSVKDINLITENVINYISKGELLG